MEKDTTIICRVNSKIKEKAAKVASDNGRTLSELINASLCDIVHRNMIPIYLNRFLTPKIDPNNNINIAIIKKCLNEIIEKQELNLIKKAYLFGSYARGEENSKSDIDVRIEADEGFSLIDIGNIRQDLSDATGKDVDLLVIDAEKLDKDFYSKVKKEEICIYER